MGSNWTYKTSAPSSSTTSTKKVTCSNNYTTSYEGVTAKWYYCKSVACSTYNRGSDCGCAQYGY
jgi:hypothetical protein